MSRPAAIEAAPFFYFFKTNTMNNTDKIWKAIERLSNKFINALHGEANGYAFRYLDGSWKTASFDFINELAGLGFVNRDLTD